MAKNSYAIIGATGHTGHAVASTLLENGQSVRVIGRNADRLQPLAQRGAEAFAADVTDTPALTRAFTGVHAAYVMMPPNMSSPNPRGYQDSVSDAFGAALEQARVPYVVALSSYGGDKESGTGPVSGLHYLEERIRRISGINAWFIRAGYFMENTLPQAQLIRQFNMVGGPLRPDLKLPLIATRDIGAFAAERLLKLDFSRDNAHELQGHGDVSYSEITAILGKAVGKPELRYTQLPNDQFRAFFIQMGASPAFADSMLEMCDALNAGHMRALEPRTPANTTPTSFEQFVDQVFVPAYKGASKAA